jgi:ABC-type dipeptide/oligopeptide/nickel transport system permease subunit
MESGHYFGTDSGRDLLVRVAIGGRISLMVGVAAALVAVISARSTVRFPATSAAKWTR